MKPVAVLCSLLFSIDVLSVEVHLQTSSVFFISIVVQGACVYAAILESEIVRRRSRLLPGSPAGLSTATVCPTIEEPYTCEVGSVDRCLNPPISLSFTETRGNTLARLINRICSAHIMSAACVQTRPNRARNTSQHLWNVFELWQDLSRLEHRLLTHPKPVLEIDFLKEGAALLAPSASTTVGGSRPQVSPLRLPVERSGRADAIAVWFDLWLDEERGDRDVVSTRPERRSSGDMSGWVSRQLFFGLVHPEAALRRHEPQYSCACCGAVVSSTNVFLQFVPLPGSAPNSAARTFSSRSWWFCRMPASISRQEGTCSREAR